MRTFPTAIQGQLDRRFGSEPLIIAEIEFVPGFPVAYSDRRLNDEDVPAPRILEVGNLDSTTLVSLQSDSQSITLTLDDADGSLKQIIDHNNISLGKVKFSLGFQGVPYSERAPLMEGAIHSPIVYSDKERTLTFTVISKLSGGQTGFSMDDGEFPSVPEDQRGLQWPLIFGTVCNVKTLPLKPLFKGVLAEPLGAVDPTIEQRLCQAQKLQCPELITREFQDEIARAERERDAAIADIRAKFEEARKGLLYITPSPAHPQAGKTFPYGNSTDEALAFFFCLRRKEATVENQLSSYPFEKIEGCTEGGALEREAIDRAQQKINEIVDRARKAQQECIDARHSQVCKILTEREQQAPYAKSSVQILGGEKFPQGVPITLRIRDVRYNGVMSGDTFTITGVTHPDSTRIQNPPCMDINQRFEYRGQVSPTTLPTTVAGCADKPEVAEVVIGPGASWRYFQEFEAGRFIWMPAGTEVFLEASSKITHIVSLLPGIVTQVAAYRTFGDSKILTEVDADEYEVNLTDYGDYQVTEIEFDRALSEIPDENWDDEVFISFQSSIGPNPVSVIKWLVETYTPYSWDTTTFNQVETYLTKYPANFVIRDRKDVFELIKDIAYQFRCAVTVRAGVVYLKYLSREPDSIRTIGVSDIVNGSFSVSTTPTEDLKTQHRVQWKQTEAKIYATQPVDEEFLLKHNVGRYGNFGDTKSYYTQNTFSTIEKSATFWMIRESNAWKYVEFKTALKHMDLDIYDCITINHPGFPVVKCIVDSMNVDFSTYTVTFRCWTPVLAGTEAAYQWAWPALQSATAVFPEPDYNDSGDGLKKTVRPPIGHPLRQGFDSASVRLSTDGDRNPSDLDDTVPVSPCIRLAATESEFAGDLEPVFRPFEAQAWSNFADGLDENAALPLEYPGSDNPYASPGNGSEQGGGAPRKKRDPLRSCAIPDTSRCAWFVNVTYVLPDLIRPGCDSGPCNSNEPNPGFACSGDVETACHVFTNRAAAEAFQSAKTAEAAANVCNQRKGVWGLYFVSGVGQTQVTCPDSDDTNPNSVGVYSANPDLATFLSSQS